MTEHAPDDFERYLRVVRDWITKTPEELGNVIRAESSALSVPYRGWGSVPKAPSRGMLDYPTLMMNDGSIMVWSLSAFADRVADLPRFVLQTHGSRGIRGRLGRLFESYVYERFRSLDAGRHRLLTEDDLATILPGKLADYVIASGRDMLIVEVSSMGTHPSLASGDPDAVTEVLERYKSKRRQSQAAVAHQHLIARRLLGLNAAGLVEDIVITQDAIPNTPALSMALGGAFVVTADEMEMLLDLAEAGMSLPACIAGWKERASTLPLGAYLARWQEIIRSSQDDVRWARAISEQFELPAA